ncbi:MAG: restriction endonuclease [Limisphaerales bacterium]
MSEFQAIRSRFLCHLLSEYPVNSPPQFLEAVVKAFMKPTYQDVYIDTFWRGTGSELQKEIVEEYNRRLSDGGSLRFTFLDDVGEKIVGSGGASAQPKPEIVFQDALNSLTPEEFEALAPAVLKLAGCIPSWATPASHDQGLDAFGYSKFFESKTLKWKGAAPNVVFLAQAKHYSKYKVDSALIREFVGATKLAQHHVYAVHCEKYNDLTFRAFSPVALVYLTSGEVSRSAKILAQNAGVILLASDEMCSLFTEHWDEGGTPVPATQRAFAARLRKETEGFPTAR